MFILTAKVVYIYLYVEHFQCTPNLWFLSADWQLQVVLLVLVVLLVKYVVSLCTPTYAAGYKNCSFDLEWRHIHVIAFNVSQKNFEILPLRSLLKNLKTNKLNMRVYT